jgi:hypothetical protein
MYRAIQLFFNVLVYPFLLFGAKLWKTGREAAVGECGNLCGHSCMIAFAVV